MDSVDAREPEPVYVGVDVGGTKIQASLVSPSGMVLARHRAPTPRQGGPPEVLAAIQAGMEEVLAAGPGNLAAIGLAVPGVVDPDRGLVVVTPNMNLTGVTIGPQMEQRFGVPVAVGNDCNLGALGESWLGSARNSQSAIAILVGTGIGSGIVRHGELIRGSRESAGEIGHIVMQIGGPKCGCGNLGCLEALASRTAIERDLRAGLAEGRSTILSDILEGDLSVIRSGALRKALAAEDELVTEVMRSASEVLGHACMTVRHLLDPEVIVLGGGVVDACGDFVVPIVEGILARDQLAGARQGSRVMLAALGDDAVVLGAVALAAGKTGRNLFDRKNARPPVYAEIRAARFAELGVGSATFDRDVYVRVDGKVKKRKKALAKEEYGSSHVVGPKELAKVCRGGPEVLFVGRGHSNQLELAEEAQRFLAQRAIECRALSTPEAAQAYNQSTRRRAALMHATC